MSTITNLKDEALDRIGRRIDAAWKRLHESKDVWREASIELGQALLEGRIQCGDNDTAFGAWLKQTGRDYISKDDRAALIGLAKLPNVRDLLDKTASRSPLQTYRRISKGRRRRKRTIRPQVAPKVDIKSVIRDRDALREENDRLREKIRKLESLLGKRGIFSKIQFRQLQMCVHPDSSASVSVRNDLTSFLVDHARYLVRPN